MRQLLLAGFKNSRKNENVGNPDQFKGKEASENWPAWFRVAFYLYLSSAARKEMDLVNTTGSQVLALPTFTGKPGIVLSALRRMKEKSELADYANEKRKDIVRLSGPG
jgi:hypothetical protein